MVRTKYEIIEVNNVEVTVDLSMLVNADDMFFNATEIAKQFDKRMHDFWRDSQNEKYLNSLITLEECNKENFIKTRTGSKYGGTWLHQKMALQFARWLSSDFAVRLDKWIIERLKDEEQRKKARLAAKTGYLELSEAVKNDHDPVMHYHYSNEANLVNRIVLDMTANEYREKFDVKDIRDNLDAFQMKAIKDLQSANKVYIEDGVPYQDRKEKLEFRYQKMCLPE